MARESSFIIICVTLSITTSLTRGQANSAPANTLSDLWSSLTTSGKSPSCPGECVHAITSLFCDHILEEISCGEAYLRCCVPNDFSYGTPVETSPPLGHELDKIYSLTDTPLNQTPTSLSPTPMTSTTSSRPLMSSSSTTTNSYVDVPTPRPAVTNKYTLHVTDPPQKPMQQDLATSASNLDTKITTFSTTSKEGLSSAGTTTRPVTFTTTTTSTTTVRPGMIHPECPGVCVKLEYARFCGNIMSNGICNSSEEACCLQSEISHKESESLTKPLISHMVKSDKPLVPPAVVAYPDTRTENSTLRLKPVIPTATREEDKNMTTTPEPYLPECEGTCVAPLFSLLCDEIDGEKFCPNGGMCCMTREVTTTTTPAPIPQCAGNCIPIFFSGAFCNRPAELIPKTTDCMSGTICCSDRQRNPESESAAGDSENSAEENLNAFPSLPNPPPAISRPLPMPMRPPPLRYGQGPHPSYPMPVMPNLHYFPNRPGPRPPPNVGNFMNGQITPQRPQVYHPPPLQKYPSKPTLHHHPLSTKVIDPTLLRHPTPHDGHHDHMHHGPSIPTLLSPPHMSDLPLCPSTCVSPMLKFTCFGANVIYTKFQCQDPGEICCVPLAQVHAYEAAIHKASLLTAVTKEQKPSLPPPPQVLRPTETYFNSTPAPPPPVLMVSSTAATTTSTTTTTTTVAPSLPVELAPPKTTPYTCGIKGTQRRESPRVVGGHDSLPGEWCWQIALINAQNQYLCGGALIGTQWVMTAAHCITSMVRNSEEIFIRVGDYDLTNKIVSKNAQTMKVGTTYIHHNYNSQTLDNDIALLKMEKPVELSDSVCLVCLPNRGSVRKPGKKCTVTGYGYVSEAGPISLKIRAAQVPVVDDQECTVKINAVTEKLFILPASSFCAGGAEGNDACQGDGGGPLVCESDGFYDLTGLVSWGFGCGRQDVPAVYTKISSFIGWINQIISVNNQ